MITPALASRPARRLAGASRGDDISGFLASF